LILTLTARIDSEEPPLRLHAIARAEHLTMEIDVTLRGVASGTELLGLINVKGEGQLKPIVDNLFERRASERTAQFADCLAKRFGAASSRDETAQSGVGPASTRDYLGRINRWLNRLWRRFLGAPTPPGK
jgi:hypothetical protein